MNVSVKNIDRYLKRLFPIFRSITGQGTVETLKILQELVPLEIRNYPSGQKIYDWEIPQEWEIRDAWIEDEAGNRLIDFNRNNLHVVNYSRPVDKRLSFPKLREHLHSIESVPEAIPYRTTYYNYNWGFCLCHNDLMEKFSEDKRYHVYIDSGFKLGGLSVGELLIPGKSGKEYLISTYICHPSLTNDNLSGIVLTAFLAEYLLKKELNFSYRIVFVPETIGAIAYCANNESAMKRIDSGFVVTTVGGPGQFGYKQSFDAGHTVNGIIETVFRNNGIEPITYPFDIHGSDERQYASPGFRINTATITKDKYYEYAYYHTSLDDLEFVKAEYIYQTLQLYIQAIEMLDMNLVYERYEPHCELMLSKHGLYPKTGGGLIPGCQKADTLDLILNLLFYSDGTDSLYSISRKLGVDMGKLYKTGRILEEKGLVKRI